MRVRLPPRVAPARRPLDTEAFRLLFRLAPALQAWRVEAAVNPAARAGSASAFEQPAAGRLEEILSVVGVEIDTTSMEPGSVLLVEDDADIREALTDVLQMERWTVEPASNGRVALERLRSGPAPDLMLLDLMMPVMDGFELLEHLRGAPGPTTVVLSA